MKYEDVLRIFNALKNNQEKIVQEILLKYYRNNIKHIESRLCNVIPERQKLIREAFNAHKLQMYFSSTLIFLSQADGICEGKMFRKKNEFIKFLETKEKHEIVTAVLGKKSAIDIWTGKKSNYYSDLNRHEVMHGLYQDYGNEINSLKALSLLCFIAYFIKTD